MPAKSLLIQMLKLSVLLIPALAGCMGYVPFRQTYWDQQVKVLCEKDGGITIYERVRITEEDIHRGTQPVGWTGGSIGGGERRISATVKQLARPDALVYYEEKWTVIREYNPGVGRSEKTFIRGSDQAIVARYVSYGRHGGDFPTGIVHDSSFRCPDSKSMSADINKLFIVIDEK